MALTIIATAGAADANSYATIAESNTYHEAHVYGTNWIDNVDDEIKAQALVWATRLLDEKVRWIGQIADEAQALGWPRMYVYDQEGRDIASDIVPQFVIDATSEFARLLVAEDRTAEPDTAGIKWMKVGTLGMGLDKLDRRSVLPPSVFSIIKHYATIASGQPRILERM
jgi:hypothetical protein